MNWGKSDRESLVTENAVMSAKITFLEETLTEKREEIRDVKQQLRSTQEALIAKEAPLAYMDQMDEKDQVEEETPQQIETRRRHTLQAEAEKRLLQEIESPLFIDKDDLIEQLTRAVGAPSCDEPLHPGGES